MKLFGRSKSDADKQAEEQAEEVAARLATCRDIVQRQLEEDHLPLEKAAKTIFRRGT